MLTALLNTRAVCLGVRTTVNDFAMSIDCNARNKAVSLLARILEGEITNYEFEDEWPYGKDPVLYAINTQLMFEYEERPEKLISGGYFSQDILEMIKRCILFLRSGLEYEWPKHTLMWFEIPVLDKLIGRDKKYQRLAEEFKAHGDFDVWPFLRQSDYERNGSGHVILGKQP